jgi:hypothetical protein
MSEALLRKAFKLHHWIARNLDGLEISREKRVRLAVSCYDVVFEHHLGIAVLLRSRINGSAFALVRPLFETFVRGAWLRHCATDKEIKEYISDRLDKKFQELIDEVETVDCFQDGVLGGLKNNAWKAMNSYTHGGIQQATRRTSGSYIKPDFTEEEVVEVIKVSGSFALLAFQQIVREAGKNDLAITAMNMLNGIGVEEGRVLTKPFRGPLQKVPRPLVAGVRRPWKL